MTTSIFGIRHHGRCSARSLRSALKSLQPDIVLIEGPPEANDLLALAQSAHILHQNKITSIERVEGRG